MKFIGTFTFELLEIPKENRNEKLFPTSDSVNITLLERAFEEVLKNEMEMKDEFCKISDMKLVRIK